MKDYTEEERDKRTVRGKSAGKELVEEVKLLRHQLHLCPELALEEKKTKAVLMEYLGQIPGLVVRDQGQWFYCVWPGLDSGLAPIGFRADYDGVRGKDGKPGHYCGHDGHAAILAGTARMLAEQGCRRRICFIFQPAEETGQGAMLCKELLHREGIAQIFGFHNIPGIPDKHIVMLPHTFACASTGMEIIMEGKPSHAAYPEAGINPARALARLILYKDQVLAQGVDGPWRGMVLATVVGILSGGNSYGVSPGSGSLCLTVRGEFQEEFRLLTRALAEEAGKLAEREGLECRIHYYEEFPATENHEAGILQVKAAAKAAGLTMVWPGEPFRWSEDFGIYLREIPGAFFGIGDGISWPQLHTETFAFNDDIIGTGIEMFTRLAGLEYPEDGKA